MFGGLKVDDNKSGILGDKKPTSALFGANTQKKGEPEESAPKGVDSFPKKEVEKPSIFGKPADKPAPFGKPADKPTLFGKDTKTMATKQDERSMASTNPSMTDKQEKREGGGVFGQPINKNPFEKTVNKISFDKKETKPDDKKSDKPQLSRPPTFFSNDTPKMEEEKKTTPGGPTTTPGNTSSIPRTLELDIAPPPQLDQV